MEYSLISAESIFKLWIPILVAILSLFINVLQVFNLKKVKNKISVWAKDSKSMATSIIGLQKNIQDKKITSLNSVQTDIEILGNFANSMFLSLEEELGRTKREITDKTIKNKKKA